MKINIIHKLIKKKYRVIKKVYIKNDSSGSYYDPTDRGFPDIKKIVFYMDKFSINNHDVLLKYTNKNGDWDCLIDLDDFKECFIEIKE